MPRHTDVDSQSHAIEEHRFLFGTNPFNTKMCQHRGDLNYLAFIETYQHLPAPDPAPDEGELVFGFVPAQWFWLAVGCEGGHVQPFSEFAFRLAVVIWWTARESGRRTVALDDDFIDTWEIKYRTADDKLKEWHANGLVVYRISNISTNAVTLMPTPIIPESLAT